MIPLGLNRDAYRGETIDVQATLRELGEAARRHGWQQESLTSKEGVALETWTRQTTGRCRVYISAGIHGDEPAGPKAVEQLVRENIWPDGLDVSLCPCLNPTGFPLNRRENADGIDLNRQYLHGEAAETRAHIAWLERQPSFDVALCLHEDWEARGFYLYELNPDQRPSHAGEIIRRVSAVCPIDHSELIETRPAAGGIIRPELDLRPQWPEALWLINHKTRHAYTLESPSDYPLSVRVSALVTAVQTVVEMS